MTREDLQALQAAFDLLRTSSAFRPRQVCLLLRALALRHGVDLADKPAPNKRGSVSGPKPAGLR